MTLAETSGEAASSVEEVNSGELLQLKILPVLKERQLQHGLRHGDYQRYRGYCTRRLSRLRHCLRLPQGNRKNFKKREVSGADLELEKADSRYLEIPVTIIERAWACAMELKQEANTETRKRIHLVSRLKKALVHAEQFQELGRESTRLDERTKLEIEAYASFIFASFHFEMQHWEDAMRNFKNAQSIYAQIARVLGDHPEASIYNEKSNELLPSMRFCAYQTGADLNISELTAQFQSAAIEAMIAQRPKMSEVNFRGYKITVPTEKIQALLVRIEDFEKKDSVKVEDYEEILVELRDAIQAVRDLTKPEQQTAKTKPSMMLSYLLYLRLKLTNSRTELLLKEKTQPKDSIRLIEMILHNFSEMKTIPELDNDDDFQLDVDNSIAAFKGIRCRYLADVYNSSKKWTEALLLYNKTVEYLQQALKNKPTDKNLLDNIAKAQSYAKSASIECRAQIVLAGVNDDDDVDSVLKLRRPKEPLIDRLNDFVLDESLVSGEPNVAVFPPDFSPVPCKPLFFDLALNHIKVPASLEDKAGLSTKKGGDAGKGITGFVKGLWGWGK
ncbi:unnamed protein product [Allacma fusca]|uniref:Signal recognition particle subunit SRP68 n=1 Tax=Allacma fusca TaxID=39272 RepID=A0A8J2JE16_9HEXA|nr:unnamed protein product [Allacma fusca]